MKKNGYIQTQQNKTVSFHLRNTLLNFIVLNVVVFFFICYELMISMTHCKVLDQMNTENMHMGNTGVIQI